MELSMAAIWAIGFLGLTLVGIPVSMSMGLAAVVALALKNQTSLSLVPIMLYNSMDSFLLLAVPFFALAGFIMETGGISQRIFTFANSIVGWMRGGLGHVAIVSAMIFGGISGSAAADAAALGPMSVGALGTRGYPRAYAAALVGAAATLDVLIPPSIIMVVYAVAAGQSLGAALVAGAAPGILGGLLLMAAHYLFARRNGWGHSEPFKLRNVASSAREGLLAVIAPLVILAGFVVGLFTPTEAAVVAVLYTTLVSVVIYREVTLRDLPLVMLRAARMSAAVLFLIATASLASYVLTVERVPIAVTQFLLTVSGGNVVVLLALINVFLICVGMFMEGIAAVIVLTPILLPAVRLLGVDPLHFGVIMITNLSVGLLTPPVGVVLFVMSGVTKIPLAQIVRAVLPFVLVLMINLAIITYVPAVSLTLVDLLFPSK